MTLTLPLLVKELVHRTDETTVKDPVRCLFAYRNFGVSFRDFFPTVPGHRQYEH